MDEVTRLRTLARVFLLSGYFFLVVLFAGLAFTAVVLLGLHWALAAFVFGVQVVSLAIGSWFGFRALRRRR
jgi:type IV secretory pathway TrbD component